MARQTKTESRVDARAELDQRDNENTVSDNLEQQAKEQESQQKDELSSKGSKASVEAGKAEAKLIEQGNLGAARMSPTQGIQGGFMDQVSVKSADDAFEGHYVTVDRSFDGVEDAYKDAGLIREDDDARGALDHQGTYGVFTQVLAKDPETGRCTVAQVRLRDETHALVAVPYDALSRAEARGR